MICSEMLSDRLKAPVEIADAAHEIPPGVVSVRRACYTRSCGTGRRRRELTREPSKTTQSPSKLRALEGLFILVVEDASDIGFDLNRLMLRAGAVGVDLRVSAERTMERLATPPYPDLVLIDYHLRGERTGIDLALWMREQEVLLQHGTKRVLFSGVSSRHIEQALRDVPSTDDNPVFHAIITKGDQSIPELLTQLSALV